MIEQIINLLIDLDPLERNRILSNVSDLLEKDRLEKLGKAKAEVYKLENVKR